MGQETDLLQITVGKARILLALLYHSDFRRQADGNSERMGLFSGGEAGSSRYVFSLPHPEFMKSYLQII